MKAKYKVGEYIRYKCKNSVTGEDNMAGGGTVQSVKEQNGSLVYVVAEGNSAATWVDVHESKIIELLNG